MRDHPSGFAHRTRQAIVDAGGKFMTDAVMSEAAQPFGLPAGVLYFRGRVGAVGDITAPAAAALLGIFPRPVIDQVWRETAAIPPAAATHAYARACAAWGERHLSSIPAVDRLAELAEQVVDRTEPSALALLSAWIAQPRPPSGAARAAHALMLLRELRGGIHFAALRTQGLDIPSAVLIDPTGGIPRLQRTGWTPDWIGELQQRAAALSNPQARWQRAEAMTDAAFGDCVTRLATDDQNALEDLLAQALTASTQNPAGACGRSTAAPTSTNAVHDQA
jgi:hypothetical protein